MIDLFLRSTKFVSDCHFLSIWLSGVMPIMNSNGDSASP